MKGYLKSTEGTGAIFQLAPKVTTIGREGCDLTVQASGVDTQHAVIEYSDQEECFVLQDLNTSQGTYVNECRVQNAAVRLAPGDIIRFGGNSVSYELEVENPSQVTYPAVHQRAAWQAPLTVISAGPTNAVYTTEALPHLQSSVGKQPPPVWTNGSNNMPPPRPPSATMRARPLSAGSVATRGRIGGNQAGWINGGSPARTIMQNGVPTETNITIAQEKEQKILRLQEEVRRLLMYETECNRKEEVIQTLREEIADLQGRLRQIETSRSAAAVGGSDSSIIQKLEGELQQKQLEVTSLKEQISRMKVGDMPTGPISREDFNTRVMEVNSLRTELDRIKKDKNVTSGLVTQMQRDMANKDTTISRLTREIENQKKEIKEKDTQLLAMQTKIKRLGSRDSSPDKSNSVRTTRMANGRTVKDSSQTVYYLKDSKPQANLSQFKRVDDNRKVDEEIEVKEKEIAAMRLKVKATETRVQEQSDLISQLKAEIERQKKDSEKEREAHKKMSADLDAARSNCIDLERTERQVRVDLQQSVVKMDRLHDRVIQVAFSTPGIKAPTERLTDDGLIDSLKKVVGERTDLYKQVKELKDNLQQANSVKRDVTDSTKKLKQQLNESTSRLRQRGFRAEQLKQEIDLVTAVSLAEGVTWMRDVTADLLRSIMTWQWDIEKALEECGINVKLSDEGPAYHIAYLKQRGFDLQEEKERLEKMLENLKESSLKEKDEALMKLREELGNKNTDEVENIRLKAEESLHLHIEEIKQQQEELRISAIEVEKARANELEVTLAQLKASMIEKEDEYSQHREAARQAIEQLEIVKKSEFELKEKVYQLELQIEDLNGKLELSRSSAEHKRLTDIASFQEQTKQHAATIITLEERLNKVLKKNKEYQSEVADLKSNVHELRTKPRPPTGPKPKVVVARQETAALEALITELRKENVDFKKQIADQQTVITGLRRDLTGASAKLSDLTGELTEAQKQKLEKDQEVLTSMNTELLESRTNLAKMSSIVDQQKSDVTRLRDETTKQKTILAKLKNAVNEKDSQIAALEDKLKLERETAKTQIETLQEEGRITSELTALGAQCRGERHDQVILRQREALTELRFRIKALEQSNPAVPSHDQALQQVMMLKKEVSELRAKDAMNSDNQLTDALVERQISRARGTTPGGVGDQTSAEVERSAHRETMQALEFSENSYLTLLRAVSIAMELEDVPGLRSMSHIPNDERQRLFAERESSCELLASRIKVLRERISRKDELLQGYEKDLSKLRQAEMLADTRASQLEGLGGDVRDRTEEMQYLREALQRTRERLDQEKRLNAAIKSKKTFHLENDRPPSFKPTPRTPHCDQSDPLGRKDIKKKERAEKTKRKNYEIKVLKNELSQREEDLTKARRSIISYQNQQSTTGAHGMRASHSAPRLSSPSPSHNTTSTTHSDAEIDSASYRRHRSSRPTSAAAGLLRSKSRTHQLMFKSSPRLGGFKSGLGDSEEDDYLGVGVGEEDMEDMTFSTPGPETKAYSAVSSSAALSESLLDVNA